jgi:CheY-like chemotaxis protein
MTITPPVILVADDHPQICMLLEDVLQSGGYDVIVAQNGLEAIQRTLMTQPALVIVDGNMPIMDGWEACARIRKQRPALPILMLTVHTEPHQRDRSFASGATMYLSKPFDTEVLLDVVGQLVAA